jgi:hypothetical protein
VHILLFSWRYLQSVLLRQTVSINYQNLELFLRNSPFRSLRPIWMALNFGARMPIFTEHQPTMDKLYQPRLTSIQPFSHVFRHTYSWESQNQLQICWGWRCVNPSASRDQVFLYHGTLSTTYTRRGGGAEEKQDDSRLLTRLPHDFRDMSCKEHKQQLVVPAS